MNSQSLNKQAFLLPLNTQTACMLVDTIFTWPLPWKSRTCFEKQPKTTSSFSSNTAEQAGGVTMYEDVPLATGCLTNSMDSCPSRLKLDKYVCPYTLARTCEVKIRSRVKVVTLPFHIKQTMLWLQLAICDSSQSVVSRNRSYRRTIATFGVFQAGTTNMSSADTAFLHRNHSSSHTLSMSLLVQKRVKTIAEGVAAALIWMWKLRNSSRRLLPVSNSCGNWWPSLMKKGAWTIRTCLTGEDFGYL